MKVENWFLIKMLDLMIEGLLSYIRRGSINPPISGKKTTKEGLVKFSKKLNGGLFNIVRLGLQRLFV